MSEINNFEHKCDICSTDLEGVAHFFDQVTEYKICVNCATIDARISIADKGDTKFIPMRDAMLVDEHGKSMTVQLKNILHSETSKALKTMVRLIRITVVANKPPVNATEYANQLQSLVDESNRVKESLVIDAEKILLENSIDQALLNGDKKLFIELTSRLNALKEGALDEVK